MRHARGSEVEVLRAARRVVFRVTRPTRPGEGSERSALQANDLIPNGELDRGD